MFDRILFPSDGSHGAEIALDHVLDVAEGHGSTVHVLNVVDTTLGGATSITDAGVDALAAEGEEIVHSAAEEARGRRITVVTEVRQGEPYRTILNYADAEEVDLIVLPTRGRRGLERFILGSTTERVVRASTVPVLTMQPTMDGDFRYPYRDVLVPTDGSECAREALEIGVDIVHDEDATLHVMSVITTTSLGMDVRSDIMKTELEASAERILDEAAEYAETTGVDSLTRAVEYGPSIHKVILSYIDDRDIDLVVVGTHGRTGLGRYLIGSVADYLIRTATIPVLTVRQREQPS